MSVKAYLAAAGTAVLMVMTAQTAEASATQCNNPHGEGGVYQEELTDGEPCEPTGGYAQLHTTVYTANSAAYSVSAEVPDGNEFMALGEVAEVEIDVDAVVAALKADDKQAHVMAVALGLRPKDIQLASGKSVSYSSSAKLTESEYIVVASYVTASMQSGGTARGRSDPAPNTFTRRVEAISQAVSRAFDSIGRNLPNIRAYLSVKTFHPNGQVKSEVTIGADVSKK